MIKEYEIRQSGAVTTAVFNLEYDEQQKFLLRADTHRDSIACNRELEQEHLEKAVEEDALGVDLGDLFDAMQGRFDPRRSMDELRPEYQREDYYDFVVKDSADFYSPYAKNFLLFARGNHETSVRKHANTDLTDRLVFALNAFAGGKIATGGYGGWLRLLFKRGDGKHPLGTINIKYFHGAGGEAPVTRGAIQTNRQAVYLPDANVVLNGHNHHQYIIPIARERLGPKGNHYGDLQYHVRIPGYKQEYGDGSGGWTVERGGVPKPIGAVWMTVTSKSHHHPLEISFEPVVRGPDMISFLPGGLDGFEPFPEDSEYP